MTMNRTEMIARAQDAIDEYNTWLEKDRSGLHPPLADSVVDAILAGLWESAPDDDDA